jgi:4-amino-4-deoxy-L-arabinose transferase-like glycosyltransferase
MASRRGAALVAASAVLYAAMRLWNLAAFSLWGDEVFSLRAARMGLGDLFAAAVADAVHPPLFYLVLKVWVAVGGEALWWLKLLPVATSIAAIAPVLLLARELRAKHEAAALALALAAVNPYLIHYAQELRMYSLLMLLSLASAWVYVRYARTGGRGWLAALFGVNLLLVYTHYFGWLVVAAEAAVTLLLSRERLAPMAGVVAALAAGFAPWVYAIARGAGETRGLDQNFRDRPSLGDLAGFFGSLDGPASAWWLTIAGIAVFCLPVAALFWRSEEGERRSPGFVMLAALAFGPAFAAFAASHVLANSVWRERYLIVSAVPYLLLAAAAAWRLPNPKLRGVWVAALCAVAVAGAVHGRPSEQRVDVEGLVARMVAAERDTPGEVRVYAFGWRAYSPVRFYLEQSGETRFAVSRVPDASDVEGDRFWIAFTESRLEKADDPRAALAALGYQVGEPLVAGEPGSRLFLVPVTRAVSSHR